MKIDYNKYLDKKIRVNLKDGYYYTGELIVVDEDKILINDIFDKDVIINKDDISHMVELQDGR